MSKRIEYIDIAKGLGILLVVLGHNDFALVSPFTHKFVYAFHMPLFFFISGYILNTSMGFKDFFRKRFNALLKPFLFTLFLIYIGSISFGKMGFQTAITRTIKSLYGSGPYLDWVQLWFLPHLFVVSLYAFFFYTIMAKVSNRYIRWFVALFTLWLATLSLRTFYPFSLSMFGKEYELYGLPFSLDLVLLTGFFFILGNEMRHILRDQFSGSIFLLFASGLVFVLLSLFFEARVDFNLRIYESLVINTAEAVTGILFVLALSKQIELHVPWLAAMLKYLGKISLIILIFHGAIQPAWGQKIEIVTGSQPLALWLSFFMGVVGPVVLYELFIKTNPVACFWFGREAEPLRKKDIMPVETGALSAEPDQEPAINP